MTIYLDMDDVLCDFMGAYNRKRIPEKLEWPQAEYGFFANLEPLKGAITAVNILHQAGYDTWILSAPSVDNPMCLTEKFAWVKKYFGDIDLHKRFILSTDKSRIGTEEDYLIDDRADSHGQDKFRGTHILFDGDWNKVIDHFMKKDNNIRPMESFSLNEKVAIFEKVYEISQKIINERLSENWHEDNDCAHYVFEDILPIASKKDSADFWEWWNSLDG